MNTQFADVRCLSSLKYFSLSSDGFVCLRAGVTSHIIDAHTHIAWSLLPDPLPEPTEHVFPYVDAPVDLSHYSAYDYNQQLIRWARTETVKAVMSRGHNIHCSASHLKREMQQLKISSAVVLGVDIFGRANSALVLDAASKDAKTFVPFISLHPRKKGKEILMRQYIKRGAKGIKIHPPMQLVRPSSPYVCSMMELAKFYRIPVLFHCGHTPLSPGFQKRFSDMDDYEHLVSWYRDVPIILGHSGIDQWERALAIAKTYENVYLELSGQPPEVIQTFIKTIGSDRLLFGSDWPYYPIALPLAKVLLATEGKEAIREKILYKNITRLLKKK